MTDVDRVREALEGSLDPECLMADDADNSTVYSYQQQARQALALLDGKVLVDEERLKEEFRMNIAQYHAPPKHKNRSFKNWLAYLTAAEEKRRKSNDRR